jgi:hypothetical protein
MITEKEYQENMIFYHEVLLSLLKECKVADEGDSLKCLNYYRNFKGYKIWLSKNVLEINCEFWMFAFWFDKSDYKAFIKLLKLLKVKL